MTQQSKPSRWSCAGSVLYALGLYSMGFVTAVVLIIGGGAIVVNRALNEVDTFLQTPQPTSTAIPIAEATQTPPPPEPPPDSTPEPVPPATTSRYDVEVNVSQQYINYEAQKELSRRNIGIGVQSISFAFQPGNVFTLYILPVGSPNFYFTFTGQVILRDNQVLINPLSSSLLLSPFRGQIAEQMQAGISERLAEYQKTTPYTITSLATTNGGINFTLVFPR